MKNKNLILSLIVLLFTFILSSCSDDQSEIFNSTQPVTDTPDISENGQNPDDADLLHDNDSRRSGHIYILSNDAVQNSVLVYNQNYDGTLTLQTTVPSGGAGSGGGLGNQGAIENNGRWLFAVNAGSNSVSSFKMANSGNLILKSTVATRGETPVSLTLYDRILYVVNSSSNNITGFRIENDGSFTFIPNSKKPLSSKGSGAAQISFSPNGRYLYVTEKATNMITMFQVNNNGSAGNGSSVSSTGDTPFGFDFAQGFMVVSNAAGGAANQSSATSYRGANTGNLSPVNGAVGNNQAAACWVASAKYGRFLYVTNTASNNVSSYYLSFFGGLFLVNADIPTENGPTEIIVSENNWFVYVLNSGSHTLSSYKRGFLGNLNLVGTTSGVPDAATGMAAGD